MKTGTTVKITIVAGLCRSGDETRFVGRAEPGTVGTYKGRHPSKRLKGWHLIQVGDLVAPLAEGQFEADPR